MGVRSCAKAIVIQGDKLLLNKCRDDKNGEYYALPGGGQNPYETLEETIVRECLEETGYTVIPVRLAALCEEIFDDAGLRERNPGYAHRVYHVFVCELSSEAASVPAETDIMQTGSEWVEISRLGTLGLLPEAIGHSMREILSAKAPLFLGSTHARWNHG